MGLSEKLVEIKSETEALTAYANGVTGGSDTRLGDAVRTLADGFGQGGGSGAVQDAAVRFIDFDGTVVEEWERSEVAGKSALPDNPSHDGLVSQGWNWSLVDIKDYLTACSGALVIVGQMYSTVSGLTEFDIELTPVTGLSVSCFMSGTKNWGDGTTNSDTSHEYTEFGSYTIVCDGTTTPTCSSTSNLFGNLDVCRNLRIGERVTAIGSYSFASCKNLKTVTISNTVGTTGRSIFYYNYALKSMTIPNSISKISEYSFDHCYNLETVSIPGSVSAMGESSFQYCYALECVSIPSGVGSLPRYAFSYCYNLKNVTTLANSIGQSAFNYCYRIRKIAFARGISTVYTYAFTYCYSVTEYDFSKSSLVPNLMGTNALLSISPFCKIRVPAALEAEWKAASNWSTYADYIYGE